MLDAASQENLAVECRGGSEDMWKLGKAGGELAPIGDSGAGLLFHEQDMGCRSQQVVLQCVAETVVDGKGNHHRHDAGGDAEDGKGGDD